MLNLKGKYTDLNSLLSFLQGQDFVLVCPGGQNQDIFVMLDFFKLKYQVIVDERSASFMALGMLKAGLKYVSVVTTSGTAVGECLAAVMESYYQKQNLTIISFDRDDFQKKYRSHQTTHQELCLEGFVRSTDFKTNMYPKHINVKVTFNRAGSFQTPHKMASPLLILNNAKKDQFFRDEIKKLNCYTHVDLQDKDFAIRDQYPNHLGSDLLIEKALEQGLISSIYHVGELPDVKIWRSLCAKPKISLPLFTSSNYLFHPEQKKYSTGQILHDLKQIRHRPLCIKDNFTFEEIHGSDLYYLSKILRAYPVEKTAFFIANSSLCRLIKYIPNLPMTDFYFNRGLNGIDGIVPSAYGAHLAGKKKVVCICGDQSFMYDTNLFFKPIDPEFRVHIINNGGGEIFRWYGFDKRMSNEHTSIIKETLNSKQVVEHISNPDANKILYEKIR